MRRVLYAYCTKPDAPQRIQALQSELGWRPVAIVTSQAHKDSLAKIYSRVTVCDKNEFAERVCPICTGPPSARNLPADVRYMQEHAAAAMALMERTAEPDSFTFRDRRRYLRKLIHELGSMLDELAPEIVHFDETPHGTPFVVLYHLCQRRGIPTVWFVPTGFTGYNFVADHLRERPLGPLFDAATRASHVDVPNTLISRLDQLRAEAPFSHWYVDQQAAWNEAGSSRSITDLLRRLARIRMWGNYAHRAWKNTLGGPSFSMAHRQWLVAPNENPGHLQLTPVNARVLSNRDYLESVRKRTEFKDQLSRAYDRLASEQPLDVPFVFFPLHFQPERTTNPEGGIYEDQFIAAAAVHDSMPTDWMLYVKEHPTQFNLNPLYASEKGRCAADYDDLLALPRVRLIPMRVTSAELVRRSAATVTVTGTAAWEAALNHVPGIHMAHTWYEGFPGTTYQPTFEGLSCFFNQIDQYVPTSTQAEREYLTGFLQTAFEFDVCEQDLPPDTLAAERQTKGAVAAMRWWQSSIDDK